MAYQILGNVVITQAIADTSTTQKEKLGRIVQAADPDYGVGEFIYLTGVASTIVGSVVEYDTTFQTGLASIALATPRPLAVSMSANGASQYGWYQISGLAIVAKASALSLAAGAAIGATSGFAVAGATALLVQGALVATTVAGGSTTTVEVMINRPTGPGAVAEA